MASAKKGVPPKVTIKIPPEAEILVRQGLEAIKDVARRAIASGVGSFAKDARRTLKLVSDRAKEIEDNAKRISAVEDDEE